MKTSHIPLTGLDTAALLMALPSPVMVLERPFETQGVVHLNAAAQQLFGQLPAGTTWEQYFPLALRADLRELVKQAEQGKLLTLHLLPDEQLLATACPLQEGVLLHFTLSYDLGRLSVHLLEELEVGATLHTSDGELLHINETATHMLGFEASSQTKGHSLAQSSWYATRSDGSLMPLEELPVLRVAQSGQPVRNLRFGAHFSSKQGVVSRWVRSTGLPQYDMFGRLQNVLTILHDETELHRFEEQVAQDKVRYRSLLNTATKLIWRAAADGSFEQPQPDWEQFTGQPSQDYLGAGMGWLQMVHPDDRAQTLSVWQEGIAKGQPAIVVHRIRRVDGEYVTMQSRGVPIKDATGKVTEWVGAYIDLSAAEAAEETLSTLNRALELSIKERSTEIARASRFNRLLLNSAAEGIFGVDQNGMCSFVNPSAARMLGYTVENLLGKPIAQLFQGKREGSQRKPERSVIAQTLHDGQRRRVSSDTFWHADGYPLPVSFTVNPILHEDGSVTGAVVTFQDISERLRNQQALEEAIVELQRSNAELEQFAYVASHDLQEPLRTFGSYTELLARRYQGQLDDKAEQYLRFMSEAVLRMESLMQDLLTFAKVGRSPLELEEVLLSELLDKVKSNVETALLESGGELVWHTTERIIVHPSLMIQLLTNLVTNAIKFRHPEQPPRIEVSCQRLQNKVIIRVKDNGIGIDAEYHERVFAIFQRLHRRDTYGGNGMGLAICRKIVERHGGQLSVSSTPLQGSTFEVTLPQTW